MEFFTLRTSASVLALFVLVSACASGNPRGSPQEQKSTLTADEIANNPNEPIEKVLQKKVPGVLVTRTDDGSIAINIRGNHSFTGDDAPLYVLDGMPFQPSAGGALTGIDPYSIESIKVLKGSEAVLYGIRGMNGVIEITMKKPARRN
jgi:TonB-dependent SusC/RagA subfamily outer membrane receptor